MEDQCSVVGPPAKIPKLEAMETEAVNVTRGGTTHALGKELQSSMYRGGGSRLHVHSLPCMKNQGVSE